MISQKQTRTLRTGGCDIATDALTRQLYATDASLYRVEPAAVAFPRNASQAAAVIRSAGDAGLAITPRGAGSGLAGGAIGDGLIIDFAKHNRQINDLDLEKRTVRVGAGVVLDQLNTFLRPHGFCFGPDVATSSRATLGGMIANNSSGAHVPNYGTTADHLRSVELVLADGSIETVGPDWDTLRPQRRQITQWVEGHADEIRFRMPRGLLKRWPGYGVSRYLEDPGNLNQLIAGSEGTLAAILSAELQVVPVPRQKGLCLLFFDSVAEAMQATVALLPFRPAAIEHIDRVLFDQTRGQMPFQAARDLLRLETHPCEAILMVEFFDDIDDRLEDVARLKLGHRSLTLKSAREMALVWALRKAGLSLLTGCPGAAKPATGIEDAAVLPEHLPEYVASLERLLTSLDLKACFYGHAAAGLLHVRPVLDLHRRDDVQKFRKVADEVAALVRHFKGSLASEHGVGIARTEYLHGQVGTDLLEVMRRIKTLFDPSDRLNPGKIISDGRYQFDTRLRTTAGTELQQPFLPTLTFAAKDQSFIGNLEQCNGCGGCRKETHTMCPTYRATGEEVMSTRGRANTIRAALEGRFGDGCHPVDTPELETALAHCLSCKACTSECPSNVNMSLLKAELAHARIRRHGLSLRQWLVSSVDQLSKLACRTPALANSSLLNPAFRKILQRLTGISERRPLPAYTFDRFDHWFARRKPTTAPSKGRVILWDDTFVRYHEPHIGKAAVAVLEAAGYEVTLPKERACCGRPAFSQGDLDRAARLGAHNLDLLSATDRAGVPAPVIFLEPSCFSMFAEDYRELGISGAAEISTRSFLFETFIDQLLERDPDALMFQAREEQVGIHTHCHAKSLMNPEPMRRLAARMPGRQVTLLDTGCCGMAGAFGAMESNYDLSVRIGQSLAEAVTGMADGATLVSSGTSCRHQVEHLTSARPLHMAELLARSLER